MKNKLKNIPTEDLEQEINRRLSVLKKKAESMKEEREEPCKILLNAIKTPDGTILSSKHVHDFVTYTDSVTNKLYGVDGGADYLKRIGNVEDCEDLSITDKTFFEVVRVRFHWGAYGKDGKGNRVDRRLKDLSDDHLSAILKNINFPENSYVKKWFLKEVDYRKDNNIFIEEYK